MTSRATDPTTSHEAAALIEEHVPRIQHAILSALLYKGKGMSTRELAELTGIDYASITPRMKPMEKLGWVEMTPVKVKSPQGKGWGHVWILTPAGRGVLA